MCVLYLYILSCVGCVRDLKTGFGYIAPYTFTQLGTAGNTVLSLFYTIPVHRSAHALGFSAFTSRIQATDLSQSHCNFKSHVRSSLRRLTHFLPFLLNHLRPPPPELDPSRDCCSMFYTPYYSASTISSPKSKSHFD
jgi:hypothetical protein